MPDAPSPWELQRAYEALRNDMRTGFDAVNRRLDLFPSKELMAAFVDAANRRITDLEKSMNAAQTKQDQDRRMVHGALLGAALSLLVTVIVGVLMASRVGGMG